MMAKFIASFLSLAAGPISHTRGGVGAASIPRLAEVSTALVLINAPSRAWALGTYSVPTAAPTAPPTEKCGPCGDTIELDLDEPYDIQSNTCYEIAGEFPTKDVAIPPEVSCAKITVKEGAAVDDVSVEGDDATIVIDGTVDFLNVNGDHATITNSGTIDGSVLAFGNQPTIINSGTVVGDIVSFGDVQSLNIDGTKIVNDGEVGGTISVIANGPFVGDAQIVNNGKVNTIAVAANNVEVVNNGKAEIIAVALFPVGTKVTNTGTKENGDPVLISAAGASEITVSAPGQAFVEAAGGSDVTFTCYGTAVTVDAGDTYTCNGIP